MRTLLTLGAAAALLAADNLSFEKQTAALECKPVTITAIPKGLLSKSLHDDPKANISSSIVRFPKGYREPRHYHTTCTHIIYVLKGKLRAPGKELTPGTFIYSARNERHGPFTAVEETEIFFHTDGPFDYHVDEGKKQ